MWIASWSAKEEAKSHWLQLFGFSPLWVFKCVLKLPALEDAKSQLLHWLFSAVHFQIYPQIICTRGCIITLVAFVWLFSSVCCHMFSQIACLRGCKVTLAASVELFSTVCFRCVLTTQVALVCLLSEVYFQVVPQIACPKGCKCKLTLVAFVQLFPAVCFQMCPQMTFPRRCIITLFTFFSLFFSLRFSHWDFYIGLDFIWIMNMLIHFKLQQVLSCVWFPFQSEEKFKWLWIGHKFKTKLVIFMT